MEDLEMLLLHIYYCYDKASGLWEIGGFRRWRYPPLCEEFYFVRQHKMLRSFKYRTITLDANASDGPFDGIDFMCQFDTIDNATLEALERGEYIGGCSGKIS